MRSISRFKLEPIQRTLPSRMRKGSTSRFRKTTYVECLSLNLHHPLTSTILQIVILSSDGLLDNIFSGDVLDALKYVSESFPRPSSPPPPSSTTSPHGPPRFTLNRFSPQALSEALSLRAQSVYEDPRAVCSPFQQRANEEGIHYTGGKRDDITTLVGIVGELEASPVSLAFMPSVKGAGADVGCVDRIDDDGPFRFSFCFLFTPFYPFLFLFLSAPAHVFVRSARVCVSVFVSSPLYRCDCNCRTRYPRHSLSFFDGDRRSGRLETGPTLRRAGSATRLATLTLLPCLDYS